VARLPKNLPSVWDSLQAEGVDMVAQPSVGRKKKMLLADMDSTMIQQECIDELADRGRRGRGGQRHHQTRHERGAGLRGRADRTGALLKGLPETTIAKVLAERITLMPGGATLVATMKANGAHAGAGVRRVRLLHLGHRGAAGLR
jgi:phosphoserine phosphatase